MILPVLVSSCALTFSPIVAAQNTAVESSAYLVKFSKINSDVSGTATQHESSCIVVVLDGHFHLERRSQPSLHPPVLAKVYDSTLSEMQLQQLRNILDDQRILRLPNFVLPETSATKSWIRGVQG